MHLNDPITMEELRTAVKAANIGKAPGLDGIPAEVIKHGGNGLLKQLLSVKCTRSNCLRRSKAGLTAHLRTCKNVLKPTPVVITLGLVNIKIDILAER